MTFFLCLNQINNTIEISNHMKERSSKSRIIIMDREEDIREANEEYLNFHAVINQKDATVIMR